MFDITDKIKEVLSYTDLVLLDIKHLDDFECKKLVGFSNKLELSFAKYLSDNNIPIWIRQVIIPGITDSNNYLIKLKEFVKTLSSVKNVELLPYHNIGKSKWEKLGFDYPLENTVSVSDEEIEKIKSFYLSI